MSTTVHHSGDTSQTPAWKTLLPEGAAARALQKGLVLRFKKEIPQAIGVIEKALRLFEAKGHWPGIAYCRIELASLYGNQHDKARSERMFREAEEILDTYGDIAGIAEVRARWMHYKGLLLYQGNDFGDAIKLFKEALAICDPQGLEAAKIYDSLGVHYERTGDFHRAVRYLKSSLFIKTHLGEPSQEEAVTCQILGRLYLLYEDYELAYQHLERSLSISTELKDEKRKAALQNELIRLFLRCGKEAEAAELIQRTRQEQRNRHLKIQYGMTCFYEVYLLYRHGQFYEAQKVLENEVLGVFRQFRYHKGLAMAKRLQAWINFAISPNDTAGPVALIGEAIELFRWENMIDEIAKSHYELGKLYHGAEADGLALASFLDALQMAEENGLFYLMPYVEDEIFRAHEPQWKEIVNKRARHERIFEKRNSLIDALTEMMAAPDDRTTGRRAGDGQGLPYLLSLLRIGQAMVGERDLDRLLIIIRKETELALAADCCRVLLYDAASNTLWWNPDDEGTRLDMPAHQGLVGYAVKTGEPVSIADALADPRFNPSIDSPDGMTVVTMLCLPMRNRKGDIIGVFQALNKQNGTFHRADEELLAAIATNAGTAIENAQLYHQMKVSFESFIKTLSSTIDARDPITAGHSDRVARYSVLIGEKMHLDAEEMEALRYAALLHDIGKIGVKEDVLVKNGRLTENEYQHIQGHVKLTHDILKNIHFEPHLACIPDIAASHHEKMDGSGYFRHLKGDSIPLGGRILAVADVFDAITSRRPYRTRMPFERAMGILLDDRGRHFDSHVVEMFLESSLKTLAEVLCMDYNQGVAEAEVRAALDAIPEAVSIRAYLRVLQKERPTREDVQLHQTFERLYHFSEISDLD